MSKEKEDLYQQFADNPMYWVDEFVTLNEAYNQLKGENKATLNWLKRIQKSQNWSLLCALIKTLEERT